MGLENKYRTQDGCLITIGLMSLSLLALSAYLIFNNIKPPNSNILATPTIGPDASTAATPLSAAVQPSIGDHCIIIKPGDTAYGIWSTQLRGTGIVDFYDLKGHMASGLGRTIEVRSPADLPHNVNPGDKLGKKGCVK